MQDLIIVSLDDEGFVSKRDGELLWASLDDVANVEPIAIDGS